MIRNVYAVKRKRRSLKTYEKKKKSKRENAEKIEGSNDIGKANGKVVSEDITKIFKEGGDTRGDNEGNEQKINMPMPRNMMNNVVRNDVGKVNCACTYCGALYWKGESVRKSCCHDGKIKVIPLSPYPTELQALITQYTNFR